MLRQLNFIFLPSLERRRALSPASFGASLTDLIAAPPPSSRALAALTRPSRQAAEEAALDRRARRLVQFTRHEREERGHVQDVIGGWGPRPAKPFSEWSTDGADDDGVDRAAGGAEHERVLRRWAQRGVVRLFNAIRAAQVTDQGAQAVDGLRRKANIGPPAATNAPEAALPAGGVDQARVNLLGTKGKEQARTCCDFSRFAFNE